MSRFMEGDGDDDAAMRLFTLTLERDLRSGRQLQNLRDFAAYLEAMPEKKIIQGAISKGGFQCAVGAFAAMRGIDLAPYQAKAQDGGYEDWSAGPTTIRLGREAGLTLAIAANLGYMNDVFWANQTPERRWYSLRAWVEGQIIMALRRGPVVRKRKTKTATNA